MKKLLYILLLLPFLVNAQTFQTNGKNVRFKATPGTGLGANGGWIAVDSGMYMGPDTGFVYNPLSLTAKMGFGLSGFVKLPSGALANNGVVGVIDADALSGADSIFSTLAIFRYTQPGDDPNAIRLQMGNNNANQFSSINIDPRTLRINSPDVDIRDTADNRISIKAADGIRMGNDSMSFEFSKDRFAVASTTGQGSLTFEPRGGGGGGLPRWGMSKYSANGLYENGITCYDGNTDHFSMLMGSNIDVSAAVVTPFAYTVFHKYDTSGASVDPFHLKGNFMQINQDITFYTKADFGYFTSPILKMDTSQRATFYGGVSFLNISGSGNSLSIDGGGNVTRTSINAPLQVSIPLSSSQILNGNTTPIQALPAPGANQYYVVTDAWIEYDYGTVTYVGAGLFQLIYSGQSLPVATCSNGLLVATADANYSFQNVSGPLSVNTALNISISGANPTLGDGTAIVKVLYQTKTLGN